MTYHVGGEDGLMALGYNTTMDSRYMGSYYGGDTLTIEFMPAGASNLPFRFLLVPEALANPQYTKIATINKAELRTLQAAAKREAAEAAKKVDKEEKKVAERMRAEERAHQQAEKAKLAVEKAKTLKKIEEARQLAEKRYHEYEIAQTQTKEARRRADMQREVQQKAAERVEEIRLAVERYTCLLYTSKLKIVARLRWDNPEASLKELEEMMNGTLSKSGIGHRLKKLEALALTYEPIGLEEV